MSDIFDLLQSKGIELITLGGKIHPYVGAGVAILVAIGLLYFGIQARREAYEKDRKQAGEEISSGVGKDQGTAKPVLDKGDDFFKEEKP